MFRRFWSQLVERAHSKTTLLLNRTPTTDYWLTAGIGRDGFSLTLAAKEDRARIECYIRLRQGRQGTLAAFNALLSQREDIEGAFGEHLDWQELAGKSGSRIYKDLEGGWRTPEADWPALQERMIDTLVQLDKSLRGPIRQLP
jgi:Domain of unknown function (DUF4268)